MCISWYYNIFIKYARYDYKNKLHIFLVHKSHGWVFKQAKFKDLLSCCIFHCSLPCCVSVLRLLALPGGN
jgi:hypothetical protein